MSGGVAVIGIYKANFEDTKTYIIDIQNRKVRSKETENASFFDMGSVQVIGQVWDLFKDLPQSEQLTLFSTHKIEALESGLAWLEEEEETPFYVSKETDKIAIAAFGRKEEARVVVVTTEDPIVGTKESSTVVDRSMVIEEILREAAREVHVMATTRFSVGLAGPNLAKESTDEEKKMRLKGYIEDLLKDIHAIK